MTVQLVNSRAVLLLKVSPVTSLEIPEGTLK